jgi:hypothetical protein
MVAESSPIHSNPASAKLHMLWRLSCQERYKRSAHCPLITPQSVWLNQRGKIWFLRIGELRVLVILQQLQLGFGNLNRASCVANFSSASITWEVMAPREYLVMQAESCEAPGRLAREHVREAKVAVPWYVKAE